MKEIPLQLLVLLVGLVGLVALVIGIVVEYLVIKYYAFHFLFQWVEVEVNRAGES